MDDMPTFELRSAASCASSTSWYMTRWSGEYVPLTGIERVMSAAYPSYSVAASSTTMSPGVRSPRLRM